MLLNPTHSLFSASDDFWNRWILTKQHQTQKDLPLQTLDEMDNETHEGQVLISASELAELRAIAKKYGRFMREKKKTVEEHATTVQRAVKSKGADSAALEMEIYSLASARRTLDLANAEIANLKATTVSEKTQQGEKLVSHPVFRVQRDALAAVTRHMKALGLTAQDLTAADEGSPLENLTEKVLKATQKAAKL